jgi:hypothetical protein
MEKDIYDRTYVQIAGCEVSHVPDGFVVYQAKRDKVHYLNSTAAIVYELCGTKLTISGIAAYLGNVFSLSEPPLMEVRNCIDSLVREGLIEPC